MNATIIWASELKEFDTFLAKDGSIKTAVACMRCKGVVTGQPIVRAYYALRSGATGEYGYHLNDLIARIDPDPVEVREYWRLTYEKYAETPDGKGYVTRHVNGYPTREIALAALERRRSGSTRGEAIEHVREIVLSRETVLPEGEKS